MKPIKLFVLFFSFASGASSQALLEIGSTWTYHYQAALEIFPETYQIQFQITAHTALNGRACAKMEVVSDGDVFGCDPVLPPYYFYISGDTLRYATEVDHIFRTAVIYDAEAGDTWEYIVPAADYNTTDTFAVTVISASTVEAGGNALRSLELTYENVTTEAEQWVSVDPFPRTVTEVLGHHGKGFIPMGDVGGTAFVCDGSYNETLQCFDSPSLSWVNPDIESCLLSSDEELPPAEFRLWPNPATDELLLEGLPPGEARVEVRSAMGAVVF